MPEPTPTPSPAPPQTPANRRRVRILLVVIVVGLLYGIYSMVTYDPNYVINVAEPNPLVRLILRGEAGLKVIGVECPPLQDERVGKVAWEFVKSCVLDRKVRIEPGEKPYDPDRWLMGYVYYRKDGREYFLNEELLRRGYGRVALWDPYLKYRRKFEEAQAEAEREKRGIWAPGYKFPGD